MQNIGKVLERKLRSLQFVLLFCLHLVELEIKKNTTESRISASYLHILLPIWRDGQHQNFPL